MRPFWIIPISKNLISEGIYTGGAACTLVGARAPPDFFLIGASIQSAAPDS